LKGKTRLIIGVTGNIGAGKTTVSRFFESWGAVLLEGDRVGHLALDLKKMEVIEAFGPGILDETRDIDRKKLGRRVFSSEENLKRYHDIIRGPMREIMKRRIAEFRKGVLIFDAALLFELGLEGLMDTVVLIRCRREMLVERALATKGYKRETVERILASQWSQDRKTALANEIIENDGSLEELEERARTLWSKLTSGMSKK
jgi:dephospho-CoA kinase